MPNIEALPASADPTEHADWLELTALTAPDNDSSAQDLITALRRAGSSDAILDPDAFEEDQDGGDYTDEEEHLDDLVEKEGEELERVADAALEQLATREEYLEDAYPFTLDRALKAKGDAIRSPYAFLTAVTSLRWNPRQTGQAASLFERVSAAALVQYLGGKTTACSYDFGFPRRNSPKAFEKAVDKLCELMGEGLGCAQRSKSQSKKDAHLDLVVWVPFGDERSNQISVFGQCTTSVYWKRKINELQPADFCKTWLKEQPAVTPMLAFFVPGHIEERYWWEAANSDRRIMFDRLRIVRMLHGMDQGLADKCAEWTGSVLAQPLSQRP